MHFPDLLPIAPDPPRRCNLCASRSSFHTSAAAHSLHNSPGADNLQIVLDTLVVDETTLFEVAHLDLLVADTRLDSGHATSEHGGAGQTRSRAKRLSSQTGRDHFGERRVERERTAGVRVSCQVLSGLVYTSIVDC